MTTDASPFAFAICQPGWERALKDELARTRPDLRAGFQRPGLVTFKATERPFRADERPDTVFARAWGCSAGPTDAEGAVRLARELGATRILVGCRDAGEPDATPPARVAAFEHAEREAVAALTARLPGMAIGGPPVVGERVLDVVVAPDEPYLAGWHRHGPGRHVEACGRFPIASSGAPSRAWRKVAEGLAWSGVDVSGATVLEFGAAPGGGTLAFAERGARVIAIDPQPLDVAVEALPSVTFLRRPVGEVRLEALPDTVDWIACDAGIPPMDVVGALGRLLPRWPRLKGLLLTLKMLDASTVRGLPQVLASIRSLRAPRVLAATHLPANRKDVFVLCRYR